VARRNDELNLASDNGMTRKETVYPRDGQADGFRAKEKNWQRHPLSRVNKI
jgi:hypothetical protein